MANPPPDPGGLMVDLATAPGVLGDNPPGTAQMLLGSGQVIQATMLAGSLMTGHMSGIATSGAFIVGRNCSVGSSSRRRA